MRLLLIGVGGVGQSIAAIIKKAGKNGEWLEKMVLADYDLERAEKAAARLADKRFVAEKIDARSPENIKQLIRRHEITFIMNAVDPKFNVPIFDTAFECGAGYMDCAMTLSQKHPLRPYELPYVKLGDYQFDRHEEWKARGIMAIVGSGVEPGISDVFARYADKHLFDEIDEVNVRDGDNYVVPGVNIAFGFSIWTTIEECLNPPIIWEKERGWFCTETFSEPEEFIFPAGIGKVEVVNVEHEEVILVPRVIDCNRVTFKYGISREFRTMLTNLKNLGMDSADKKIKVGNSEITPREFLAIVAPSPLETSAKMVGKGCAGTWVTGKKDGLKRSVYLYQVADNQKCIKRYGTSSVVVQTAVGPVVMLDLVANGKWFEAGVHGPESFDPDPFVEKLAVYGFPASLMEMDSEYERHYGETKLLSMAKVGS
jgi:saccharopine dehydrogenase (NAD+, L-lysine-forming)